jgi:hypothetical protein
MHVFSALMGILLVCPTRLSKNHFARRFSCQQSELSKALGFARGTGAEHFPVAEIGAPSLATHGYRGRSLS